MPRAAVLEALNAKASARSDRQEDPHPAPEGRTDHLAEAVGLSPSPCLRRVKALEESGVIRTYVALVDPALVDLPVNVFVSVILEKQVEERLDAFEAAIKQRPEVLECYLIPEPRVSSVA